MTKPFAIDGPAVISFSGGRTSAYMLRRILDEGLRPDVHVLFANTGKERLETLDFIHECETRWNVAVHWVEYWREEDEPSAYQEMSYETASRGGEPFDDVIRRRGYLPNPVTRYCTSELKIRPIRNWMRAHGFDDAEWTNIVGIRADEPRRAARMRDNNVEGRWDVAMPLVDAGVTLATITEFWQVQPFDLKLHPQAGNCDLCFLKSLPKKVNIIRDRPALATWWASHEAAMGKPFRIDQPGYAAMLAQPDLFADIQAEDIIECYCYD